MGCLLWGLSTKTDHAITAPHCTWMVSTRNKVQCELNQNMHYSDVIMGTIASQITSPVIVYSTVYSDADQRKHQSSASLAFVWGIHRGPVNSPHKWPVTRKMFPFDDVIMIHLDYEFPTQLIDIDPLISLAQVIGCWCKTLPLPRGYGNVTWGNIMTSIVESSILWEKM